MTSKGTAPFHSVGNIQLHHEPSAAAASILKAHASNSAGGNTGFDLSNNNPGRKGTPDAGKPNAGGQSASSRTAGNTGSAISRNNPNSKAGVGNGKGKSSLSQAGAGTVNTGAGAGKGRLRSRMKGY